MKIRHNGLEIYVACRAKNAKHKARYYISQRPSINIRTYFKVSQSYPNWLPRAISYRSRLLSALFVAFSILRTIRTRIALVRCRRLGRVIRPIYIRVTWYKKHCPILKIIKYIYVLIFDISKVQKEFFTTFAI